MSEPSDRPWLERDRRPPGVSDQTVEAVGKFDEALEWIERARGHLYDFHQMMGHADALIGEAADQLRDAGHQDQAQRIETELVGRNALEGRWSWRRGAAPPPHCGGAGGPAPPALRQPRGGGRHHVFESEMKEDRRTHGARFHEQRPDDI